MRILGVVAHGTSTIFVERLWQTVKHEHIYLSPDGSGTAIKAGLESYFVWHNGRNIIRP